jgi:cysteinyl-tRNA synthetase
LLTNFAAALDDDLNISAAWGAVFDWVRETNKRIAENLLNANDAATNLAAWERANSVLGIIPPPVMISESVGASLSLVSVVVIPTEILALLEARQAARKTKDFKKSDAIRDELRAKGWLIEDTPKGPKLKKI